MPKVVRKGMCKSCITARHLRCESFHCGCVCRTSQLSFIRRSLFEAMLRYAYQKKAESAAA